jgi:hypothetical protein
LSVVDFLFETEDLFFDVEPADFEPAVFVLLSSASAATFAPASIAPTTAPVIAPLAAPFKTSVKVSVAALTISLTGLATFFLQVQLPF